MAVMRLAAALLISFLIQSPAAAPHPDFSGRWTEVPAAAGAAGRGAPGAGRGDMGSGWGSPITITQTASQLTVEYAFFSRGDMQPPLKYVFALDGSETSNKIMMGSGPLVEVTSAAWDGEKLVLKTRQTFTDPGSGKPVNADMTQTLSLASPTSLVVEAARAGVLGGAAVSTKTSYQK
jgi:hypothetical protein